MKKTLPSVRVAEDTINNIRRAIEKYNHNPQNIITLDMQEFRRLSYELLSQLILQDREIPIELK